jgi:hypothetical protein
MKIELIFIGIGILITLVTFVNLDYAMSIGASLIMLLTFFGLLEKK